ncbi:hypothetical protein Sipo8835_21280 [Streptomyces ipomoeae]|uniref:Isoprenylcysteine carboxylmethyltransferase family protein n=1 Tax=Streptomyces ipomoeae TaxID=103232 RepID=A0AAE9B031_9ACTN|nr:hypothetical protein Sipo8835_21280 [Streptomyces ipomoeae]
MPLASAVACERLLELRLSWKNARWAKARGGVEYGQRHFPCMVAARIGLFIGILTEVALAHRHFIPVLGRIALGVQAVVHAGRWWCARSLGPRWNTHVIVVPGMPLVDRGPYRWLRHPNHMVVVAEGIALPLVHSAWLTALLFTAADAAVLTVRLRVENKALGLATQVRVAGCRVSALSGRPRLTLWRRHPARSTARTGRAPAPPGSRSRGFLAYARWRAGTGGRTPEGERGGPPTPPLRGGTMRQTGPTGAKTAMSKEMQDCVDACMACHSVRDHIRRGQRRHTRAPHHQGGRRAGKLPAAQAAPSAYPRLSGAARHQAVGRGHVCRRRSAVSCRPGCRTTRGS